MSKPRPKRQPLDEDLYYSPPGTRHYNVQFVGGVLQTRVLARSIKGMQPEMIESVWIIEAKRRASQEEIKALCRGIDISRNA